MTKAISRAGLVSLGLLASVWANAPAAWAEPDGTVKLFKIVTVRDEIVVGLTPAQQQRLDLHDAAGLAHALKTQGTLAVWRYAVGRGSGGELLNAPTARIGLLAHDTLRVEPYATSLPIAGPKDGTE